MDAKYELEVDDEGRFFWNCKLDGKDSDPCPVGFALNFPADPETHEDAVGDKIVVAFPLGTTVHIKAPSPEESRRLQVQMMRRRIIYALIQELPSLTIEEAEALMMERLKAATQPERPAIARAGAETSPVTALPPELVEAIVNDDGDEA